jgi:hypothetical protein
MTNSSLHRSLHTLLHSIVDYAGLFPPAALDMESAVREYAAYRASADAWMLGRFVVPAARLGEFESAAGGLLRRDGAPWRISALVGPEHAADVARIRELDARREGEAVVDCIETRGATPAEIDAVLACMPSGPSVYVEVPVAQDPRPLLERIAAGGARAKIRTGGITPEAFPPAAQVARFLAACAALRLPFKATAGLHHPVRGPYRLTYAPDSPSGVMFGFLNVFIAAAALRAGATEHDAIAILEETSPEAFRFDDDGVAWRDRLRLDTDALARAREESAIAFGSCSFREPVDDLRTLHLL